MKKEHRKSMEKPKVEIDEILPEYDFRRAKPNKFAIRYAAGSNVVVLDPDVSAVFQNASQVNEALRALAGIIQKHRAFRGGSRRSAS